MRPNNHFTARCPFTVTSRQRRKRLQQVAAATAAIDQAREAQTEDAQAQQVMLAACNAPAYPPEPARTNSHALVATTAAHGRRNNH